MPHEFRTVGSELLVDAPIIAVRRDDVVMPGDVVAQREIVEHLGAVAVVALDEDNRVAMVEQYRHSVSKRLWELPAGLLDVKGEDELSGAQRELQEEAGLAAEDWGVLTPRAFVKKPYGCSWRVGCGTSPSSRPQVMKKPTWGFRGCR